MVLITFGFAYLCGYALNIGPLMQEGISFAEATKDAVLSETPSITIMEIAAIGTDLLLAASAGMGQCSVLDGTGLFAVGRLHCRLSGERRLDQPWRQRRHDESQRNGLRGAME